MYRKAHQGQAIANLYERLNHQKTLTSQLDYLQGAITNDEAIRIAYTSAGRPTAVIIRDNHAVLENALFQTVCNSEPEAYYLIAIINSGELAKRAKPLCPTNWAKEIRHFHKHGWKLPIPLYGADDPVHVRLSELGAAAEQECQALIAQSDIMSKPAGDGQSRAARRLLRHEWQPNSETAQAIEAAVAQLLSDPAQAALAGRQMNDGANLSQDKVVVERPDPEQFGKLADQWEAETVLLSNSSEATDHPAYQAIIDMGELVVPLILERMQSQGGHWFHALRQIANADPVKAADRGDVVAIQAAWLEWGEDNGYV